MRHRRVSFVILVLAGLLGGGAVGAQQVLDFKPVPRESVSRLERMRVVRHRDATAATPPATPAEPEEPPATPAPSSNVDRSGSIMRIGSDIYVGKDEVIEGDLSSVSGDITIEGRVEGDVVAMRGDVTLKSTARVDGDVVCLGGTLTEEPGAEVEGQKVTAPLRGWRGRTFSHHERDHTDGEGVASALVWLLVLLFFGWVFTRFLEGRTQAAEGTLRREPGLSLGIGAMVWALIIPSIIALALVVALLCITIIGIPLAMAAIVGYALFLTILAIWGFTLGAAFLGGGLARRSQPSPPGGVMPPEAANAPTLMRSTLIGVTGLMGAIVVGSLLRSMGDLGPLRGLGTLIMVLAIMSSFIAMTAGAGALLRTEFVSGTFTRVWNRRRAGSAPGVPGAPAVVGAPAVTAPPAASPTFDPPPSPPA